MKENDIFLHNRLFDAMDSQDIDRFLTCANPLVREFSSGEIVLEQGGAVEHLLLLSEGEIELYKEDYEGNRSLVASLKEGDTYGEQTIFGQDNNNAFQLVAASKVRVVYIDKGLFYRPCGKVCQSHQALIRNMLSLLADQAGQLEKKITYLTAKSLRKKISLYLWEEYLKNGKTSTFTIKLNREDMAEYFDVQRPSLSRELVALKNEGIIDYYRCTFKILDSEKLQENTK